MSDPTINKLDQVIAELEEKGWRAECRDQHADGRHKDEQRFKVDLYIPGDSVPAHGYGDTRVAAIRQAMARIEEGVPTADAALRAGSPRPPDYLAKDGLGQSFVVPGYVTFEPWTDEDERAASGTEPG